MGNIYTLLEDYDSAKDVLLTAIQIDPTYADGHLRLGVVFSQQELFFEALIPGIIALILYMIAIRIYLLISIK